MHDKEKVIKGLECCIRHGESPTAGCGFKNECPYEREGVICRVWVNKDALELLKEQEQRIKKLEEYYKDLIEMQKYDADPIGE